MQKDGAQEDLAASGTIPGESRLSRRQAIGRMSVFATAGAAAWVAPEILTAMPAGGATLSAPVIGASTLDGALGTPEATVSTPDPTKTNTLAFTGLNIQRDAEVGAALLASGWALHHWASRTSTSRPPARGTGASA